PRWSPDGGRLLYVSSAEGSSQLWVRWMDTGQEAMITHLTESPSNIAWSPDGRWVAFTMHVPERGEPIARMPPAPEGAEWAPAPKVIDDVIYRADGAGYLEDGHTHVFVVPADGGTPRQLTTGPHDHGAPAWTPDGAALIVAANRR